MAQLKEVPFVIKALGVREFTRRVWQQIGEDDVFTWAASLAYSWMFAVFPFLIFLMTLVPLLPEKRRLQAERDAESALRQLPAQAAEPMITQVRDLLRNPRSGLLSIGLAVTLWAAAGGMSMTMTALDRCYDIRSGRSWIHQRLIAILLTCVVAVLIILVMILLPISTGVIAWFRWKYPEIIRGPILWALDFTRFFLALLLMFAILGLVYQYGPSLKQRFHMFTPGSVFCVAVWMLLVLVFRFYVNHFAAKSYSATYGAVAGVAILLLFFYIDATVLLIGAEINSEVDFAVLGLPSSDAAHEHAVPTEHHTDEHKSMIEQLSQIRR